MYILSLDVGIRNLGYAILKVEDGEISIVESGCFTTSNKHSLIQNLGSIYDFLSSTLVKFTFDYFVYEEPVFFHKSNIAASLNNVVGVILLSACHSGMNGKVYCYSANEVKKAVTGKGKASKEEIQEWLKKKIKSLEKFTFKTDHESDAIAIGLTHILKLNNSQ